MRKILFIVSFFLSLAAAAQSWLPAIHGTVRGKFEYEPQIGASRFEVRNARISVSGNIIPIISYKAEIDLCDEGKIKMLDAYARFSLKNPALAFTIGQMRVPFTIDAHRSPHQQFFANRSFIAKQVGNVRDVGLAAAYKFPKVPITLEAGIFNGSGLTNQKDFWTKNINFSVKAQADLPKNFVVQASCQKIKPSDTSIFMVDAGAFFDDGKWHVEGEYLRKIYSGNAFPSVNAADAFASRKFPIKNKFLSAVSALLRYDYMSNHSNGEKNDQGALYVNDPERHRITGGATLSFGKPSLWAELRLNYEKYFYPGSPSVGISDHDKLVLELMVHF